MELTYLKAKQILKKYKQITKLKIGIKLLCSFEVNQLLIYIETFFAIEGFDVTIETLPFNTLKQFLINEEIESSKSNHILILTPWDFCEKLDWRRGFSTAKNDSDETKKSIISNLNIFSGKGYKNIIYLDIDSLPLLESENKKNELKNLIINSVKELGSKIITEDIFSLNNYIISGCPLKTSVLPKISKKVSELVLKNREPRKLLITDLDNTFWSGILGEEGVNGIRADQEREGYKHFLYQTLLKYLKLNGVLLCAISKNEINDIKKAFYCNDFIIDFNDFILIIATYEPKSLQINQLISQLNLTEDSFLFIDDNEIEIQEVSKLFGNSSSLIFPEKLENVPEFISEVIKDFPIESNTNEDRDRTDLYRRRLKGLQVLEGKSQDIRSHLIDLEMNLEIKFPTAQTWNRSIQLINKTNQFNLNGIRYSESEISNITSKGGKIISGLLNDRYGSHGEVICLLVDSNGAIVSFVMSCRVFQRELEYYFLSSLLSLPYKKFKLEYRKTKKNIPFKNFLVECKLNLDNEIIYLSKDKISNILKSRNDLFISR